MVDLTVFYFLAATVLDRNSLVDSLVSSSVQRVNKTDRGGFFSVGRVSRCEASGSVVIIGNYQWGYLGHLSFVVAFYYLTHVAVAHETRVD